MLISKMIEELRAKQEEYGDMDVIIHDSHGNCVNVNRLYVAKYGHRWLTVETEA